MNTTKKKSLYCISQCNKVPAELEFLYQLTSSSHIFTVVHAAWLTLTRLPFFRRCYCFVHFICCPCTIHLHTLFDSVLSGSLPATVISGSDNVLTTDVMQGKPHAGFKKCQETRRTRSWHTLNNRQIKSDVVRTGRTGNVSNDDITQ